MFFLRNAFGLVVVQTTKNYKTPDVKKIVCKVVSKFRPSFTSKQEP